MRIVRIYTDQPLPAHSLVTLAEGPSHHISRVLRMRVDQRLQVFNGSGGCHEARIVSIGKRHVEIELLAFRDEERESNLRILLAQGISRGQHMDYTIQKAVELGVSRIVPVLTEHGNVSFDGERTGKRLQHWEGIIVQACEQCGRNRLPEITAPVCFTDWVVQDREPLKLLLDPDGSSTLPEQSAPVKALSLLCGPEGGFSREEIVQAHQNGYTSMCIGPRVLRTETAAIAALSTCQVLWGDMCK